MPEVARAPRDSPRSYGMKEMIQELLARRRVFTVRSRGHWLREFFVEGALATENPLTFFIDQHDAAWDG